jgi:hypothetical protein
MKNQLTDGRVLRFIIGLAGVENRRRQNQSRREQHLGGCVAGGGVSV